MVIEIPIKPLSVNDAWKGRRFKSDAYKRYERDVMFLLPNIKVPEGKKSIEFHFWFSSKGSDCDNPAKSLGDILSKKYGYNDNEIYEFHIYKHICPKGQEKSTIEIKTIE